MGVYIQRHKHLISKDFIKVNTIITDLKKDDIVTIRPDAGS